VRKLHATAFPAGTRSGFKPRSPAVTICRRSWERLRRRRWAGLRAQETLAGFRAVPARAAEAHVQFELSSARQVARAWRQLAAQRSPGHPPAAAQRRDLGRRWRGAGGRGGRAGGFPDPRGDGPWARCRVPDWRPAHGLTRTSGWPVRVCQGSTAQLARNNQASIRNCWPARLRTNALRCMATLSERAIEPRQRLVAVAEIRC